MGSELTGIVRTDVLQHGTPYLRLHIGIGLMELHLVEETTLKGLVEVARQVGGGDKDTVQVLYLLQDDVLHGVVHLIDRVLDILRTLVDDGIGLVEEEDGHHRTITTEGTVALEHFLDILLTLPYKLVTESGRTDRQSPCACPAPPIVAERKAGSLY